MSRGFGRIERTILDSLRDNQHLDVRVLAAAAYGPAEAREVDPPTAAQQQAVRRALSKLQKRGLVVKLGHLFNGERCSYADREHALITLRKYVRCFGLQSLRDYPQRVQELYADEIAGESA